MGETSAAYKEREGSEKWSERRGLLGEGPRVQQGQGREEAHRRADVVSRVGSGSWPLASGSSGHGHLAWLESWV